MIHLVRYHSDSYATFGHLSLPDGYECYTLELPWRDNKRGRSCVPAGQYVLLRRRSPVVERTSANEFTHGYELTPVPGRSYIMIHPGNWPGNTEGCILVGRRPQEIMGRLGVPSSRTVFRELMARLDQIPGSHRSITVSWSIEDHPGLATRADKTAPFGGKVVSRTPIIDRIRGFFGNTTG